MCHLPTSSKSRQTGSGHAADLKLRHTIQFSILMLSAKYQKAGLCGSREKCDRNYLVSKFAYVHNIQSRKTGSGHAADSKLCYTIQLSILMLCAKYQEAGLCGSWEKCDRNFCDADDARRQKWSLYVAYAKAGRRHKNIYTIILLSSFSSFNEIPAICKEVRLFTYLFT